MHSKTFQKPSAGACPTCVVQSAGALQSAGRPMANHIAAIHTLKSKLRLSDDDYRALLCNITGKRSSKALSAAEQARVRNHMQALGERMGVLVAQRQRPMPAETFAKAKAAASPRERKVWALWHQLHRDGVVRDASARSLRGFVERQTGGVSDLRFCNAVQLDAVIEALKSWKERGGSHAGYV